MTDPKKKKENKPPNTIFMEELLKEDPSKLICTEMGTILADYMNAFTKMKKDGDIPNANGFYIYQYFQNCLMYSLQKRFIKEAELLN